jgi:hypothetical protein
MPASAAEGAWLTYRDGKKPLLYLNNYKEYVMCAHVYLNGVGRADLLPLLSLRYAKDTHASHAKAPSWMVHKTLPVVRLGHKATFFPEADVAYIRRGNADATGKLAQYLMHRCGWQVFAFSVEVPESRAVEAEKLAVPVHTWFKRGSR